jgi:hypothetical protein
MVSCYKKLVDSNFFSATSHRLFRAGIRFALANLMTAHKKSGGRLAEKKFSPPRFFKK